MSNIPDDNVRCHHTGFKMKCHTGVTKHRCQKWIRVTGLDPQTGNPIDNWACADSWLPYLMVENSKQQRQTAKAIETFRDKMIIMNQAHLAMMGNEKKLELTRREENMLSPAIDEKET